MRGPRDLRAGMFLAPFHPVDEDPTLALRRDIELVEWLDELGFEEAWIGEHHSAGYEIIASPEVFIAAAAERTSRIRLGTAVIRTSFAIGRSLPQVSCGHGAHASSRCHNRRASAPDRSPPRTCR